MKLNGFHQGEKMYNQESVTPTSVSGMYSGGRVRREFKAQGKRLCVPLFGELPPLMSQCLVMGSRSN